MRANAAEQNEKEDFAEIEDSGGAASSGDGLSQQVVAGEEHGRKEEGEEGREPKGLSAPQQVSREEREMHELTHTPYRAWCRHCVKARGRNTPHRTRVEERIAGGVPKISMDYFFISKVDEQAHNNPLIVMVDEGTGEKYARAVGQKGLGSDASEMDWLIKDMSDELRAWGHPGGEGGHIILKSDGERAIVAVRDALAKYHGGKVVPESPPRGESQSNGTAEEAGKTVREFVRVLKEQVEHSAKIELGCAEVLTVWMIRWAAMLCSKYLAGKDGLTAYERRRGKRCSIPVVTFGEKVWYKELRTNKDRKGKFESEWREGIWLGHARQSNEAVIGTREGVVRAYSIKRQDVESRWDAQYIKELQGTPQQPDPGKPGLAIPIRINFDPVPHAEAAPVEVGEKGRQIRRMKITASMLEKYGYTSDCEGCRYKRAGLGEARNHTEACRTRIEEEMCKDEEGRRQKADADERINHRIAAEMERVLGQRNTEGARGTDAPVMLDAAGSGGTTEDSGRNVAGGGTMGTAAGSPATEPTEPTIAPETAADNMVDSDQTGPHDDAPSGEGGAATPGGVKSNSGARQHNQERSSARSRSPRRHNNEESEVQDGEPRSKRSTDGDDDKQNIKRRKEDGQSDMELGIISEILRLSVDIAEMYSPPRVTREAAKFGMKVGEAMDLTTGWDFTKDEHKNMALKYIEDHTPKLIIGSPMCTIFSQLQRLSGWSEDKDRRWKEDRRHLQFIAQVYRIQIAQGRWFLHEHPSTASSWSLKEIQDLMDMDGVGVVQADQCMYSLRTWGRNGRGVERAKKRTQFMSNSDEICKELCRKCDGRHRHQALTGGRAEGSARYPEELCRAICMGLMREISRDRRKLAKLVDVGPKTCVRDSRGGTEQAAAADEEEAWKKAWDDITGEELDPKDVAEARAKEMKYVNEKKVWKVIPRREAQQKGWKIINTRWIDINKGDKENPNYRSRLVAKEFNDGVQHDGLFAATPPLEALRLLISEAATIRHGADSPQNVIMINDVARAFFEAPVRRTVCVELPPEALGEGDDTRDLVGLLQMSLYGTRDAAANFQAEVRRFMTGMGFTQSKYSPSVYWHKTRGLKTLVHGDDFITSGTRQQVAWLKEALERRFEIKTKVIGTGDGEISEERVLNRIIRVTEQGWEYEADQRHGELIVRGMNLQDANGVKGLGEDEKPWEEHENDEHIPQKDATAFRALAARANYLAQDRADILYSAKEVCRGMAQPTKGHMKKLRRLARYLLEVPRVVWKFKFQGECDQLQAFSDSDWAGCKRTARSTTGGVILRGSHCIRSWCSTQKFVTLSSAEAELMAAVRATTEAIGITQLADSWGVRAAASVLVDSSAALAVVGRKGNGKLRHVKVGHLWIQEKSDTGEIVYRKVRGECNPADLMTKYLPAHKVLEFSECLGQIRAAGHARARLAISPSGPLGEGLASVANHSRAEVGDVDLSAQVGSNRPRRSVYIDAHESHPQPSCVHRKRAHGIRLSI